MSLSVPDHIADCVAAKQFDAEPTAASDGVLSPGAFFDREDVCTRYRQLRDDPAAPVIAIERPIVLDFLGEPKGREFLDIGCGNAWIGRYLLDRGAKRYLGLDVSHRLLSEAQHILSGTAGEVEHQDLELWSGTCGHFDAVISRLALQYVENFGRVLEIVRRQLRPAGVFVFSVEHPVLTSICERPDSDEIERGGPLHQYFREGERTDTWLGATVRKYHRTLQTYVSQLLQHGFLIHRFSEGCPKRDRFASDDSYEVRLDFPVCIVFRCVRIGGPN
ncbi:bifunctional 2-polyprenyl-6-hydroxyphenol methylase/3-demethylubiquinol 3-O-methyltransferase UbiG [Bradyrhizobium sp. AUGA SZCCT0431]|uniref:class I SAM-dependent methyltransferase n=1 Tax=Bradyrhizobium sp. AUGA SZCCT0431 TaxID=2807674 RepID=UPI001BADC4D5|nr:methyltransferase domain-containing protein [Bradyrhizobium sp. AUGA SZCCT0431]MBR1147535.1 class I SAM-dependent methyltransferase [Bradyrhizobium sp. AUGA SZCCT0431]